LQNREEDARITAEIRDSDGAVLLTAEDWFEETDKWSTVERCDAESVEEAVDFITSVEPDITSDVEINVGDVITWDDFPSEHTDSTRVNGTLDTDKIEDTTRAINRDDHDIADTSDVDWMLDEGGGSGN